MTIAALVTTPGTVAARQTCDPTGRHPTNPRRLVHTEGTTR